MSAERLQRFQHLLNKRVFYNETRPDGCTYSTTGWLTSIYEVYSEYAAIPFASIATEPSGSPVEVNLSHVSSIGLCERQHAAM